MRVVYVDELFLLNFAVDYIVLRIAAHFSSLPYRRWRLLAGAAAGAAYAVAAYLGAPMLSTPPIKLAAGAIVVLCAFGYTSGRAFATRAALFFVASFLLGGLSYAASILLGGDARGGAIAAPTALRAVIVAVALLLGLPCVFAGGEGRATAQTAEVVLSHGGRTVRFSALRDSGNLLRDPLDGSPVIVVEPDAVAPLFDRATAKLLLRRPAADAVGALGRGGGWRLLPCATAAGTALLAAFRPDGVSVDGASVRALVAVSPHPLGALPALVGDIEGANISRKESAENGAAYKAS